MALESLGLIADLIGIASILPDQYNPPQVAGTGVSVKIAYGNGEDGVTGFDGAVEAANAWDYSNVLLGTGPAPAESFSGGDLIAITIDQEVPDRQGRYVGLSVGDDVCIIWITVNQHDGSYSGTWNGDIGKHCGQPTYHGTDVLGTLSNGQAWTPMCVWFGTGDNGEVASSLKFNTLAYGLDANQTAGEGDGSVCGATIYSPDVGVITDQPAGVDTAQKRRSTRSLPLPSVRPEWMEQTLVVSGHVTQTADELCTDGMSWGPDFVDAHGNYCDMETKTLSPLCTDSVTTGCVNLSDDAQAISKRSTVARRTVDAVHRTYTTVRRIGPH